MLQNPTGRPLLEFRPGESVAQRYWRLADHARKLDPRVIAGAASVPELDRMEKVVARLEKEADEKAKRELSNDPRNIASGKLRDLWRRAHEARQEILELQEGKAKAYRRAFAIIRVPAKLFAPPPPNAVQPCRSVDCHS
jgi:hypothetical protein